MLRKIKHLSSTKALALSKCTKAAPKITLNNCEKMPMLGLGTFKGFENPRTEIFEAVKCAIDAGYRHIDCAFVYGNEKEIGQAVKAKIKEGVIKREDIFITSKLWNTFHAPELVQGALCASLRNLDLAYLDLYLMHWPMGYESGPDPFPRDRYGNIRFSEVDYIDTWLSMEYLVQQGMTKSIGVSNFNICQLKRLLPEINIKPVVNQVECHPYLPQLELSQYCANRKIVITAYASLGSPTSPFVKNGKNLMKDKVVQELAKVKCKTPAQLLIRYQLDRGHVTIPKSVKPERIKANFDVLDFSLTPEDVEQLNALNQHEKVRYVPLSESSTHKYHPFK